MKKVFLFSLLFALIGCGDERFDDITELKDDSFTIVNQHSPVILDVLANDVIAVDEYELCLQENKTANGQPLSIIDNQLVISFDNTSVGIDSFYYCVRYRDKTVTASVALQIEPLAITGVSSSPEFIVADDSFSFEFSLNAETKVTELAQYLKGSLYLTQKNEFVEVELTKLESVGDGFKAHFQVAENNNFYRDENATLFVNLYDFQRQEVFNFAFFSKPKMAQLNWPQRSIFTRDSYIDNARKGIIDFHWLNLGAWEVPQNHSWEEDPFKNVSWKLFYHSLGWLTSIAELYNDTKNDEYLNKINSVLISYNDKYTVDSLDLKTAYREDAVALRVNHLLYIYLEMEHLLSNEAKLALAGLFNKDAIMLKQYLDDPIYDDENHGLIQAKSGLNLYSVFPYLEQYSNIGVSSLSCINKASVLMFDQQSGQNLEQATEYHFVGISMLLEAKVQLDNLNIAPSTTLLETLDKAIFFSTYFLNDEGVAPAIGDSYSNKYWRGFVNLYYKQFSEYNELFEEFKQNGQDALDDLLVSEGEGLVIAKNRTQSGKLNKVFFDAGPKRIVHGHFDNLNVIAQLSGVPLLVDSGGPFNYGNTGRRNFWSISAHNSIVINRLESNEFDAQLVQANAHEEYSYFSGVQPNPNSLSHKRVVIFSKSPEDYIIIFDWVDSNGENVRVDEYWHFNKLAKIESLSDPIIKINDSEFIHFSSEQEQSCELIKGTYDEKGIPKLGWVSEGYNTAEPAFVKKCTSFTNTYQKTNLFSENNKVFHFKVTHSDSDFIVIEVNDRKYKVDKLNMEVQLVN